MMTTKREKTWLFKPGDPKAGRPKGTPNKTTRDAKRAIELAFDGIGGVEALIDWAKEDTKHRTVFYSQIWPRILPKEMKAQVDVKHSFEQLGRSELKQLADYLIQRRLDPAKADETKLSPKLLEYIKGEDYVVEGDDEPPEGEAQG